MRVLIEDVGEAGVSKMSVTPGLAAAVDQHVAAIRDELSADGITIGRAALLTHLREFAAAALHRGWWPDGDYDWEFVRIVAVCWLLRDLPDERSALA